MSFFRLLTACLVAAPLMLSAPETWAQNHPEIPDIVDVAFVTGTPVPPVTALYSGRNFVVGGSDGILIAYGSASKSVNTAADAAGGGVEGFLRLRLYEPDKIQRKADKTQLKQKTFVTGFLFLNTPAIVTAASKFISVSNAAAVDCRGQIKLAHDSGGFVSSRKWSFQCKESVISSLGLTALQLTALENLFGSSKKLKLAGKSP